MPHQPGWIYHVWFRSRLYMISRAYTWQFAATGLLIAGGAGISVAKLS